MCLALLLAHSGPGLDHMDEMDHGTAKAVMSLCLAVVGSAVALLGAWAGAQTRRPPICLRRDFAMGTMDLRFRTQPLPAARAGPARLQVFLR